MMEYTPVRKVAFYFGSFNPIHCGHLAILRYLVGKTTADEVRLVVSPESPFKKGNVASAERRLQMVTDTVAREKLPVKVSDVEFHLPAPLYTINTLRYIRESEPDIEPVMVMGGDSLVTLESWHCGPDLMREFEIWVYPRPGYDALSAAGRYRRLYSPKSITVFDAELYDISSTQIRNQTEAGRATLI